MKPTTYEVSTGINGMCKSPAVWVPEGNDYASLFYIERPKWIKDDYAWSAILSSIKIELPQGFEVRRATAVPALNAHHALRHATS